MFKALKGCKLKSCKYTLHCSTDICCGLFESGSNCHSTPGPTPAENRAFREKRRLPILYFEGVVQKSAIGALKIEESGYLHTAHLINYLALGLGIEKKHSRPMAIVQLHVQPVMNNNFTWHIFPTSLSSWCVEEVESKAKVLKWNGKLLAVVSWTWNWLQDFHRGNWASSILVPVKKTVNHRSIADAGQPSRNCSWSFYKLRSQHQSAVFIGVT